MTDTVAPARAIARAESKYFYFQMALIFMGVAFVGFLPTYWIPMAGGIGHEDPVLHIHGMIFFTWTLYFAFQTWLAASGQVTRHRAVGLVGVSISTAMFIFGVMAAIHSMQGTAAAGHAEFGKTFAIIPLSNIAFFAIVIAAALANTRRPEWHKRLMVLAGISVLGPAFARWFLTFLPPVVRPPTPMYALRPEMIACLLLAIPIVHDWRTRGRPHPVYLWGGAAIVGYKLLRIPVGETQAWHAVAGWIAGLAS